ncbi:MAG: hypothetical protein QOE59_3393 [Actinomycetota bacterium]|jgi:hypothetical protein|nr:hypothetical protein [Actinomycetota bacterium]
MGDRFACHTVAGLDPGAPTGRHGGRGPAEPDWFEAVAALDECDGYVVLMVDPQTAEIDAHGPFGGPDAVVAAEALRTSLDSENLTDVVVRIVRLHLPPGVDAPS